MAQPSLPPTLRMSSIRDVQVSTALGHAVEPGIVHDHAEPVALDADDNVADLVLDAEHQAPGELSVVVDAECAGTGNKSAAGTAQSPVDPRPGKASLGADVEAAPVSGCHGSGSPWVPCRRHGRPER